MRHTERDAQGRFCEKKTSFVEVHGFKAFNNDLTCRGFQYAEGHTFKEKKAELCCKGFHYCLNPFDIFGYYPFFGEHSKDIIKVASVTGKLKPDYSKQILEYSDSKVVTKELHINKVWTLLEFLSIYCRAGFSNRYVSYMPNASTYRYRRICLDDAQAARSMLINSDSVTYTVCSHYKQIITNAPYTDIAGFGNKLYAFGDESTVNIQDLDILVAGVAGTRVTFISERGEKLYTGVIGQSEGFKPNTWSSLQDRKLTQMGTEGAIHF